MDTQPNFDVPIPGQAMTAELGARPWQNTPEYSTVDEAISYYMKKMSTDEFSIQLIDVMEMGVPLTDIANIIQLGAVTEGAHTVDIGILVIPVLIEMMMLIGDSAGVKYTTGLGNSGTDKIPSSLPMNIVKKLNDKTQEVVNKEPDSEPEEKVEKEIKGLMGRKINREN